MIIATNTAKRLSDERYDLAEPAYGYERTHRFPEPERTVSTFMQLQRKLETPAMVGFAMFFLGAQYFLS